MTDLELAKHIAKTAHKNQKRKNGEDYINHCIRVSKKSLDKSLDKNLAIVGMLHDVIEDSDITIDDLIKYGFDIDIINAIDKLTRKKDESYIEYIINLSKKFSHCDRLAFMVKIYDLEDNLNGTTGTLKDKYQLAYYILTGEDIS